jgi:hypothetical protein
MMAAAPVQYRTMHTLCCCELQHSGQIGCNSGAVRRYTFHRTRRAAGAEHCCKHMH